MPLRILHVIGGLELGGAETLLYRVATHHSEEVEHEVVCLSEPGWYSDRLVEHGVRVVHLGLASAASSLHGVRHLRALIRERKPDVVHSWMYLANLVSGLAARKSGVPVVWSIHASTLEHLGLPSRICAIVGGPAARSLSAHVVNCSQHSAREHAKLGYSRAPSSVIPNGYDPTAFFPDQRSRQATRAALGIDNDEFVVGTIARWHSEKDVPTFLAAITALESGVRCVLIGPELDPSNAELMASMGDRTLALGRRDDVADLARAIDLHVLSSRSEAFPNVIAETMLSGTPNAVTDVGDSAFMVGDNGWVVAPRDPEGLATAIDAARREWSDDPDRWKSRQEAARRRIADRFGLDAMLAAYQRLWENLAEARHAQDPS